MVALAVFAVLWRRLMRNSKPRFCNSCGKRVWIGRRIRLGKDTKALFTCLSCASKGENGDV